MGPEDDKIHPNDLYLITKDGHKVPMAATMICIPGLIKSEIDENEKSDDIALNLFDSYTASFTVDLARESAKRLRRYFRRMKRYKRRQIQQYKRKLAKEKKRWLITLENLS